MKGPDELLGCAEEPFAPGTLSRKCLSDDSHDDIEYVDVSFVYWRDFFVRYCLS